MPLALTLLETYSTSLQQPQETQPNETAHRKVSRLITDNCFSTAVRTDTQIHT